MGCGIIQPRGANVKELLSEMKQNEGLCRLIKNGKSLFMGIRYDSVNLYYMGVLIWKNNNDRHKAETWIQSRGLEK